MEVLVMDLNLPIARQKPMLTWPPTLDSVRIDRRANKDKKYEPRRMLAKLTPWQIVEYKIRRVAAPNIRQDANAIFNSYKHERRLGVIYSCSNLNAVRSLAGLRQLCRHVPSPGGRIEGGISLGQ